MSPQDASGVLFEVSNNPQNLRLLELPLSLLELIRSNDPPYLMLKSAASPSDGTSQNPAFAVLCTNNHTFQVRQVQSSNSVFVLQPTDKPLSSDDTNLPVTNLRAIAQCPSLLELVPMLPPVIAFLRQNLPVYHGERSDGHPPMDLAVHLDTWDRQSRSSILEDAPFSAGEFNQAWREICAFEHANSSWIPTAVTLAKFWEAIVMATAVRGIKLDESFSISTIASTAEAERYPDALLGAVLARVSSDDERTIDDYARLDRVKCVSWVGAVFLESLGSEILVSEFINQWQDRLPEGWREYASLEALKGKCTQPTSATITYDERESGGDSEASLGPKAATTKAKPNWHEKLKKAKR